MSQIYVDCCCSLSTCVQLRMSTHISLPDFENALVPNLFHILFALYNASVWWCDKRNLTFLTCIVVENTSRYTIKWNVFNVFTNCISCNWCIKWLYCFHVMARPCVILCWQIFATVHICIALLDLNYFRFAIEIHTIETSLHWLIGDSWCNILYSLTSFPWMAGPGILHRPFVLYC